MPDQDRYTSWGWGGGWRRRRRLRRLRRIEPSPDFAQFLVGELDSEQYAQSLIRSRRADWVAVDQVPLGPIARAKDAAVASARPTATSRMARVSPEYVRFLREEISSSEYADALARCARLEGSYRAPAARRFPFSKRNLWGALLDCLRLIFTVGGMASVFLGLFLLCAALGTRLATSIVGWAWTLSLVGAVLVAFTVRNEVWSLFLRAVRLLRRL